MAAKRKHLGKEIPPCSLTTEPLLPKCGVSGAWLGEGKRKDPVVTQALPCEDILSLHRRRLSLSGFKLSEKINPKE